MCLSVKSRHLKHLKCTVCDESLCLYANGLICKKKKKKNHTFDKQSEVWRSAIRHKKTVLFFFNRTYIPGDNDSSVEIDGLHQSVGTQ